MTPDFPGLVPEIPVKEIKSAAAYYQGTLGFTVDWGGDDLGLAGISRGNCRIFLANEQYRKEYGNIGPVLTWLNLDSREAVDELYRVWRTRNARLVSAPESKPWGYTSSQQRTWMEISFESSTTSLRRAARTMPNIQMEPTPLGRLAPTGGFPRGHATMRPRGAAHLVR